LEATLLFNSNYQTSTVIQTQCLTATACRYEGITRHKTPHGKGTFTIGALGAGAGVEEGKPGDIIEGEFVLGFVHGLAMYTSSDGKIYKGEFSVGKRDGCGYELDLGPWRRRVKKGMDPEKALEEAMPEIERSVQMGTWREDSLVDDPNELDADGCSMEQIGKMMTEVESVVQRARMFSYKPGGDVRFLPGSSSSLTAQLTCSFASAEVEVLR
jgi:hypothetical protein